MRKRSPSLFPVPVPVSCLNGGTCLASELARRIFAVRWRNVCDKLQRMPLIDIQTAGKLAG